MHKKLIIFVLIFISSFGLILAVLGSETKLFLEFTNGFNDSSIYNNHAECYSNANSSLDKCPAINFDSNLSSNVSEFDGNDFLFINDTNSLDLTNNFSISGKFYFNNDIGNARLISKENATAWSYRLLTLDGGVFGYNDALFVQISANGKNNSLYVQVNNTLANYKNKWVLINSTYGGSSLKLYVNNTLIGNSTGSVAIYNSDSSLGIGADSIGRFPFNGKMDNIRINSI